MNRVLIVRPIESGKKFDQEARLDLASLESLIIEQVADER